MIKISMWKREREKSRDVGEGKEGKRAGRGWREKGSFGKVEDMDFATDCKDPRERWGEVENSTRGPKSWLSPICFLLRSFFPLLYLSSFFLSFSLCLLSLSRRRETALTRIDHCQDERLFSFPFSSFSFFSFPYSLLYQLTYNETFF